MPSTSNAVGTLMQQGPTPLLAKIIDVAPQRPPYLYNEHETIASNNFYNNNTQAEHAAPRNNLLLQYSLGGEPTASGIIAATAPIDHLLSISGTKKGSFIARSTPPRRSTTARPGPQLQPL
ncbi:hypothetical protein V499_02787 [Pseudogymnoascus sp. VKM F-103]|nr:hypothetical protein V499_02787 [Pseudogymnoascus sp. VKM F-103]